MNLWFEFKSFDKLSVGDVTMTVLVNDIEDSVQLRPIRWKL